MSDGFINWSRRSFLKRFVLGLTGLLLIPRRLFSFPWFKKESPKRFEKRATVVLARNKSYGIGKRIKDKNNAVKMMLEKSLMSLTGENEESKAWKKIVSKNDVVGLKLNCLAAPNLSPSIELVNAIIEGLKSTGVKANSIIVWERSGRELLKAGFKLNKSKTGVRYFGTDHNFNGEIQTSGSVGSLFSKIMFDCSAIINVGVLKDHYLSGVGAGMKNFYGVIHNPNKYHDNNCDPYIADLCNHPLIKDKLRLTVIDALKLQYDGGPAYDSGACVEYNGILIGVDPVSLDRISYDLIDKERIKNGLKNLKDDKRYPSFLNTAGKIGLGEHRLEKINLISI